MGEGGKGKDKTKGGGPGKGGRSRAPGTFAFLVNHRKMLALMANKGALELQQAVSAHEEAILAYDANRTTRDLKAKEAARDWEQSRELIVEWIDWK